MVQWLLKALAKIHDTCLEGNYLFWFERFTSAYLESKMQQLTI